MVNLADIAGAGATVQITFPVPAKWIQVIASGVGTIRVGDSTTTSSKGLPLASGTGQMLPPIGIKNHYQSGELYAYIPNGATLSVAYEP